MSSLKFIALAQNELDDLFESLEYQKKNQGYDFIAEVENTLHLIKTYPDVWTKSSTHTQRCVLKGFPYAIIYQKVEGGILVVAIKNLRKKPTHWASKSVSEYSTCRIPILPDSIYTR